MKALWLFTTAVVGAAVACPLQGKAVEWQPLPAGDSPSAQTSTEKQPPRWTPVATPEQSKHQPVIWTRVDTPETPAKTTATQWDPDQLPTAETATTQSPAVVWSPVEPTIANDIEDKLDNGQPVEDPAIQAVAIQPPVMPSGATFANDKAIWRDEQWHPQISGTVPVGFGAKGWMLSSSLWGIDCVTGAGFCATPTSWDDYRDQIERSGEAQYNISLGFGDSEKLIGVTVTGRFEETNLPFGDRNILEEKNILSNYYLGLHLSRSIGQDTSVKFGMDNWLGIGECEETNRCGFPKSAYGVISQRIRLNQDQNAFLPNAYLTIGAGNGQFRNFGEMVRDSIAKQRSADCTTVGFTAEEPCTEDTRYRAIQRASRYGKIYPIGALAIETFPGMNIIGEWSGRNLNAGFSVRPFEEVGLVLTGMWENILPNCDYGCTIDVPDYPGGLDLSLFESAMTERARFSFQASLEIKF